MGRGFRLGHTKTLLLDVNGPKSVQISLIHRPEHKHVINTGALRIRVEFWGHYTLGAEYLSPKKG